MSSIVDQILFQLIKVVSMLLCINGLIILFCPVIYVIYKGLTQ